MAKKLPTLEIAEKNVRYIERRLWAQDQPDYETKYKINPNTKSSYPWMTMEDLAKHRDILKEVKQRSVA